MENRRTYKFPAAMAGSLLRLCLALLTVYLLVKAVIAFLAPESLWTLPQPSQASFAAPASQSPQSYNFSFDPFHREQPQDQAPVDAAQDAPETTLNLKLFGRRAGAEGSAIIQTPDNKQKAYSIGDEIINGVELKSVLPGYVVLSLNGRLERLTFTRDQESVLRVKPPENLKLTAEGFMRDIEIKSVAIDGGGRGYQVNPRFGGAKLGKYGLERGDILLSMGGTDLTRGQPNWRNIADNISRTGEISAKINRGGKVMTVKVKT